MPWQQYVWHQYTRAAKTRALSNKRKCISSMLHFAQFSLPWGWIIDSHLPPFSVIWFSLIKLVKHGSAFGICTIHHQSPLHSSLHNILNTILHEQQTDFCEKIHHFDFCTSKKLKLSVQNQLLLQDLNKEQKTAWYDINWPVLKIHCFEFFAQAEMEIFHLR